MRKYRHLLKSGDSRNSWTGSNGAKLKALPHTDTHTHTADYLEPNDNRGNFREL